MIKKILLQALPCPALISVITLLFTLCTLNSCEETSDQLPAFIQIDSVHVQANSEQGTASHHIVTVSVLVNNQSIGVYEPPTNIPILAEGNTNITLFANIANNGIFNIQSTYPLYASTELSVNLTPLVTTNIQPVFNYNSTTIFVYNTDFEFSNNFTMAGGQPSLSLVRGPAENVFEGTRSAMITLNEINSSFNMHNSDFYILPSGLRPIYLEMNYKCTAPFEVFIEALDPSTGNGDGFFIAGINTKEQWNKIYVDLREAVNALNNAGLTQQRLSLRSTLPEDIAQASFFWDNIKLLHTP